MAGDRPVLTQAGYERLQAELESLRQKRVEVIEEVRLTRSYGDLRENYGYHAARQAYGIIEGQIKALELKLSDAKVIEEDSALEEVSVGVPVTVRIEQTGRLVTYTICDGGELEMVEGGISSDSPLAEALLYLSVGDETEAETPRGAMKMTIVQIGD